MDIIVSARHMDLSEAMKNSVIANLNSLNHSNLLTKAEVVLDTDHKKFIAEIVVKGKVNLEAKAEMGDMYQAIDKAVDRLQVQLDKKFAKIVDNHKGTHLGQLEAKHAAKSLQTEED